MSRSRAAWITSVATRAGARRRRQRPGRDTRRAAKLDVRAKRIESETAAEQRQLSEARLLTAGGERMWGVGDHVKAEVRQRHGRWLDDQAALPDNAAGTRDGRRRDYPALAGLVGHQRSDYERQSPGEQRKTRLNIDRELRLRRELGKAAAGEPGVEKPQLHGLKERRAAESFDRDLDKRMSTGGRGLPPSLQKRSSIDTWREDAGRTQKAQERTAQDRGGGSPIVGDARKRTAQDRGRQSSMLSDARKVANDRKRQFGRPKKPG